ncbi:DUF4861 family protein [Flavobacterium psychrotrophum]|uniref:DUF4861 family protein n=1 Tax=Flavobacterium psychrotrophum TaxID=2294119 RepID=UPI000E320B20|nr:DUF4861 family protein [Flavobacterium psychrotrophum]
MNYLRRVLCAGIIALSVGVQAQDAITVTVKNTLDFERNEVIAVPVKSLKTFLRGKKEKDIRIKNSTTGKQEPFQWIDYDGDKKNDEVLLLAKVPPHGFTKYVFVVDAALPVAESELTTYSRFVPERTDDYAWENDRVAFRVYGPDAQKRFEEKRENGTLGSGIDLWLKRTDQPIINSWYKGYISDPMYYHTDRGEGYDPYHVGASRGTGGTGVWDNEKLLVSKNFVSYKTIATGPLRTIFELTYAPYSDFNIKETKRISLDLATNFSKIEVSYNAEKPLPNYTVGITLHKNEGTTFIKQEEGVFAHEEKIDGAFLGEALLMDPDIVQKAFAHKSKEADQSNLLVVTKPAKKLTYYAGFAWEKSGQVKDAADWEGQLKKQAEIIANPLQVSVK